MITLSSVIRVDAQALLLVEASIGQGLRALIEQHLIAMTPDDRYLRFFARQSDDAIRAYVNKLDFVHDGIFVVFNNDVSSILGLLHVAKLDSVDGHEYELGLTVSDEARGMGLGLKLFDAGITWAKAQGGKRIYINCLTENKVIQHLATKLKMKCSTLDFDTKEGELQLDARPNAMACILQDTSNSIAIFDMARRKQVQQLTAWVNDQVDMYKSYFDIGQKVNEKLKGPINTLLN
jgi:RimJ/RimL family protein N-acetyltransferase